jgi:hypothetical protein
MSAALSETDNETNNKLLFTKALFTCWDTEWVPTYESNMSCLIYQHEICPTDGRRHIQGYVEFQVGKRVRRSFFDKWKGQNSNGTTGSAMYVKRVSIDNGASEYCLKEETSVPGTRVIHGEPRGNTDKQNEKNELIKQIEDCMSIRQVLRLPGVKKTNFNWAKEIFNTKLNKMEGIIQKLRPWQSYVINKLKKTNDRQIIFVIDYKGNNGKTELGRWMFNEFEEDVFFCQGGKYTDIMHAYGNQKFVIMDLPRATDPEHVSYHALESFKDGQCFSGKYQSTVKIFNRPKVIVFANKELCWDKLSEDRYKNTRFFLNNDGSATDHRLLDDIMMWDQVINDEIEESEHDTTNTTNIQNNSNNASTNDNTANILCGMAEEPTE